MMSRAARTRFALSGKRGIHPALMDLRAWLTGPGAAKVEAALTATATTRNWM
jgi:hypothetical protein